MKTLLIYAVATVAACAQTQPPSVVTVERVIAEPGPVVTVPVGETQVVKFRFLLSTGATGNDFRLTPFKVQTFNENGADVTTATTTCKPEIGQCTIKSAVQAVLYTTMYSGSFGMAGITSNFIQGRSNLPATMDITTSLAQADNGSVLTAYTTSSVSISEPVAVRAFSRFDSVGVPRFDREIYFPNGLKYGQRIEIYSEEQRPMSFIDRRGIGVQLLLNGRIVAQGFGETVAKSETRNLEGSLNDSGDLVFTVRGSYNPSVDYTITVTRGDNFRFEMAQSRGELFVYPEGGNTKIVLNRGSLAGNKYRLEVGQYNLIMQAFDRSNSSGWSVQTPAGLNITNGVIFQ